MKKLSLLLFILFAVSTGVFAQGTAAAKAEFKRLTDMQKRLAAIPMMRLEREPHKSYIRRNKKDIVYSEPAGQWLVRSDRFWSLQKKYQKLAIAEDIAWAASQNMMPGECEGYINCYVYSMTETEGKYLSLYPNGKHQKEAVGALIGHLENMTEDDATYDKPADEADRIDLKKMLVKLRGQLSIVKTINRTKLFALIDKLEAMATKV